MVAPTRPNPVEKGTEIKHPVRDAAASRRDKKNTTGAHHTAPPPVTPNRRNQGSIPSAVAVLFTKLKSKDKNSQVQALHAFHKMVLQGMVCILI
jgi:hypothetical protein